jgi:hypothetical protein
MKTPSRSKGKAGAGGAGRIILHLLLLLLISLAPAVTAQLPESGLSVRGSGGKSVVWWRSAQSPTEWKSALPALAAAVQWRKIRPGLESSSFDISGEHVGWRVRIILVRVDPAKFFIRLDSAVDDANPAWSIDTAPANAALALNAGQFESDLPWGWIVRAGREVQPPRPGPLSSALTIDASGHADVVDAAEIADARTRGNLLLAFQSYPAILVGDGRVPEALRGPGRGVDLKHRDSRVALGLLRDGRLLIALTRFGGTRLPFGPTTPEMAAIMGALGCRRAMLLDGGLSGQLMFRDAQGRANRWPGLRSVPLGLLAFPKPGVK